MSVRGHAPSPATAFVLLLPLLLAAQPVATDSYLPALPEIARDLGSASASLTAFVLAFGIAQLGCGPLSDRVGRRPVLLTGLAVYAIAAAGAIFSPSMAVLVAFRVLQGFAMAAIAKPCSTRKPTSTAMLGEKIAPAAATA